MKRAKQTKCAFCSAAFESFRKDTLYCSVKCCSAAQRERRAKESAVCKNCGAKFQVGPRKVFCSDECGDAWVYKKRRAEYVPAPKKRAFERTMCEPKVFILRLREPGE